MNKHLVLVVLAAGCVTDVTGSEAPVFDLEAPAIDEADDGKADSARQIVFLNFGGARIRNGNCSDAPSNCSRLVTGTQDLARRGEWQREMGHDQSRDAERRSL